MNHTDRLNADDLEISNGRQFDDDSVKDTKIELEHTSIAN